VIHSVIQFSVRNPLIIGLLTLLLALWGGYSLLRLPLDAVPDITNNQVQVVTVSPSLAPREMEQYVTFPVELALANLQGVEQIRSISRYGLSVVTIVFEESVPQLDARQRVEEQLKAVREEIPPGMGSPSLMPITTGLGEIFQYTLEPRPGYEQHYSLSELRSIQDWIVKRYLNGVPGVVEISSFGGFVKQYEVRPDPLRLRELNLSVEELREALAANNGNAGGSYVEQGDNTFYIRTEGMISSEEDIRQIVVALRKGIPLRIGDVAEVGEGHLPRFGALTRNGQGEALGGITLMLRGANSNEVVGRVRERIASIQRLLPEGLEIRPFLDRSALVQRAIRTVRNNLAEGGLIVVFILVLLLGNLRAGLVVASVIPLSMLFAAGLMRLTGVSANLMSLGAIDFGLIIDGAVIVVEGIVHQLHVQFSGQRVSRAALQDTASSASSQMMRSAVFGEAIILIVYLPILSLEGIEGKMFAPMAQTVAFAIIGAMLFSLTYVPMMTALLLSRQVSSKPSLADRLMGGIRRGYLPLLKAGLRRPGLLIAIASALLIVSGLLFTRLGGEFIPRLDEGDMAMQLTLPPGSSLSSSIRATTEAESLLLSRFPEISKVVSKIGTAEVPTDPMAVEDADVMIVMKDPALWPEEKSRDQLAAEMKAALAPLAERGVSFEFTQPIELRFNELITGAKSDVTVDIFGEELGELARLGEQAAALIRPLPGAGDVRLDRTEGFPQWVVRPRRERLAAQGLSVEAVNRAVETAFAGGVAGTVFEGERRFDLVVRFDSSFRRSLGDLRQLMLRTPSGALVPLEAVADIRQEEGPMMISRENTRRKITVGINVRNRDVESLVADVQAALEQSLPLPPGYSVEYGGEFANLQSARARLAVAVPLALFLIFMLLYLAFGSLRPVLIVFSAIPFAAIGGVLALWLRGMPFSISAGIGFIALFGVAVLNGIVLISQFQHLREAGIGDLRERIIEGAASRLRPVLMTASVGSLGFLPMAISTSAGAEVQRPLATVVVGGLITATLLTLLVLPALYSLFGEKRARLPKASAAGVLALLLLALPAGLRAQEPLSLPEALRLAEARHPEIRAAELALAAAELRGRTALALPATEISWQYGQINADARDQLWTFSQSLGQPLSWGPRQRWLEAQSAAEAQRLAGLRRALRLRVSLAQLDWLYTAEQARLWAEQDSLFARFEALAQARYASGAASRLEWLTALQQREQHRLRMQDMAREQELRLLAWRQALADSSARPREEALREWPVPEGGFAGGQHPYLGERQAEAEASRLAVRYQRSLLTPDFSLGYFQQTLELRPGFNGLLAGISLPLWRRARQAEALAAELESQQAQQRLLATEGYYRQEYAIRQERLRQQAERWTYYRDQALPRSDEMMGLARRMYAEGELDYATFWLQLQETLRLREAALEALWGYNRAALLLQELSIY
jgi:cobalt-zinc-cadmium resistance protein CzcA